MTGKRICKICGCEYDYCRTNRPVDIFRWQDVACSPEHGAVYFQKIAESRKETSLSSLDSMLLSDMDGRVNKPKQKKNKQ